MRFSCDKCHTKYSIADDRVHGKILKIRCKSCNNIITVREETTGHPYVPGQTSSFEAAPSPMSIAPAAAPVKPLARALDASFARQDGGMFDGDEHTMISTGGTAAAPPPMPPADDWFVSFDGEQEGPYAVEKAAERSRIELARGKEAFGWKDGFESWLPVTEIADIARHLRPPAPPRPPMPPIPPSPPRPPMPEPIATIAQARTVSPSLAPANAAAAHASAHAVSGSSALAVAPAPAMQPAEAPVARAPEPTLRPVENVAPVPVKAEPAPAPPIEAKKPEPVPAKPVEAHKPEAHPSIATGGETPTSIAVVATPIPVEAKAPAPVVEAPVEKKAEPAKVEPAPAKEEAKRPETGGGDGVAAKAEPAPAIAEAPSPTPPEPAKVEAKPVDKKGDDKPKADAKSVEPQPVDKKNDEKAEAKPAEKKPKADAKPVDKKGDDKPKADAKPVDKKGDDKPKADARPVDKKAEPAKVEKKPEPQRAATKSTGDSDLDLFISEPSILGTLPPDFMAPSQSVVIVAPGAAPASAAWLKWAVLALGIVVVALGGTLVWVLVLKKPAAATVATVEQNGRTIDETPVGFQTKAPPPGTPDPAAATGDPKKTPAPGQATKTRSPKTAKTGPAATGAPGIDPGLLARMGGEPERAPIELPSKSSQSNNTGGDPSEQIGKVVTQNKKAVQSCYERALRLDESLSRVRIDVTVQVGISGRPKKVSVPPQFADKEIGSCLVKTISRWNFPSTGSEYEAGFPLLLQASTN